MRQPRRHTDQLLLCDPCLHELLRKRITARELAERLSLSVPVVLLDSYFPTVDCSSVLINNIQGSYLATNYLIDRCRKQPGHLCSSYQNENFAERTTGFMKSVREHGMSIGKSILHELSPSIEGAFTDMLEIIDRGDHLAECYFADNDLIAIGAVKALKVRGYKVPDDIAVIGFDNIPESRIVDPALTTIDIPRKFMGQTAACQLIKQLASRPNSCSFCSNSMACYSALSTRTQSLALPFLAAGLASHFSVP